MERRTNVEEDHVNLLERLQDAIGRGQNPMSIFPSPLVEPEIITISESDVGTSGTYYYLLVVVCLCLPCLKWDPFS